MLVSAMQQYVSAITMCVYIYIYDKISSFLCLPPTPTSWWEELREYHWYMKTILSKIPKLSVPKGLSDGIVLALSPGKSKEMSQNGKLNNWKYIVPTVPPNAIISMPRVKGNIGFLPFIIIFLYQLTQTIKARRHLLYYILKKNKLCIQESESLISKCLSEIPFPHLKYS